MSVKLERLSDNVYVFHCEPKNWSYKELDAALLQVDEQSADAANVYLITDLLGNGMWLPKQGNFLRDGAAVYRHIPKSTRCWVLVGDQSMTLFTGSFTNLVRAKNMRVAHSMDEALRIVEEFKSSSNS